MNLMQAVIEAFQSLKANKLRSSLTILGIFIGVAAVIAMLSVGQGAQDSITGEINSIGSNLIFISPGSDSDAVRNPRPLSNRDVQALRDTYSAPSIKEVAPMVQANLTVSRAGETLVTGISGVTPQYMTVRSYSVQEGQYLSLENEESHASVAVIGTDIADTLFGKTSGVVGETLLIQGNPFRIIGVLESKGGGMTGSQDREIHIPMSTAQARLMTDQKNRVSTISISATSADTVDQAEEEIKQILRLRHNIYVDDDFTITSQKDIIEVSQSITNILIIFLGGVAGISLLVGGIGIMNIMMVSVTERTREIGLRKALGARKRDILFQFLTESSLLSLVGGILGVLVGWLLASLIGWIAALSGTSIIPTVKTEYILLATLFSAAVGLFFGIYPANRAANLEPVEALRSL